MTFLLITNYKNVVLQSLGKSLVVWYQLYFQMGSFY